MIDDIERSIKGLVERAQNIKYEGAHWGEFSFIENKEAVDKIIQQLNEIDPYLLPELRFKDLNELYIKIQKVSPLINRLTSFNVDDNKLTTGKRLEAFNRLNEDFKVALDASIQIQEILKNSIGMDSGELRRFGNSLQTIKEDVDKSDSERVGDIQNSQKSKIATDSEKIIQYFLDKYGCQKFITGAISFLLFVSFFIFLYKTIEDFEEIKNYSGIALYYFIGLRISCSVVLLSLGSWMLRQYVIVKNLDEHMKHNKMLIQILPGFKSVINDKKRYEEVYLLAVNTIFEKPNTGYLKKSETNIVDKVLAMSLAKSNSTKDQI